MGLLRVTIQQSWWPNEMLYSAHWPVYRKPCANACSFRSSAVSQRAKSPTCSICRKRLFDSVSFARVNNFNSCMHLKAASGLLIAKHLLLLQVRFRGRLASTSTPRSVLRTRQRMTNCTARYSTRIPRFCGGIMQKDSLESLLLRHYGDTVQAPPGLEE